MLGEDFETRYCRKYRVAKERFERSLLIRSCHFWSRPLTVLLVLVRPELFEKDFHCLSCFRHIQNRSDFRAEIAFVKAHNQDDLPAWRKTFQIWPSTKKLLRFGQLFE
jgi:hypothetical protein